MRTCLTKTLRAVSSWFGPPRVFLRKASRSETMMDASMVSRNTTKNTGTENTSVAILTLATAVE